MFILSYCYLFYADAVLVLSYSRTLVRKSVAQVVQVEAPSSTDPELAIISHIIKTILDIVYLNL